MSEWSEDIRCQCSYSALNLRVSRGWEHERAITQPLREAALIQAFGEIKTIEDWSKDIRCKCQYKTLLSRILYYGWDSERAITFE